MPLISQSDQGYVEINGTAKFDRRPIENAKVEVFENALKIKQYSTNINGRFDLQLDLNKKYILAVSKSGMITKRVQFDTHVPENEIGIWTYKFTIEIFPMVEGLDISILEKPVAKIKFDDDWGEFDYDEAYTKSMLKDIDKLLKEYENLKLEAYDKTIAMADQAYENEEYEKAIQLYDRAIDFNPYDEYPDDMIYTIDRILTKQYAKERKYEKAIEKADEDFNNQNWDGAETYYKRALSYMDDPYPKSKLKEIEAILNQKDASEEELARIEEEFRKAMFAGDAFRTEKKYYEARDSYIKASELKPGETLPRENIAELNLLIAELEKKDKDKKAKEKAYNDAIAAADQFFNEKQYQNSKSSYEKALTYLPYESYPQEKIREIDQILKNQDAINADYNKFVAAADNFFTAKQYTKAKSSYQEALGIKPGETYPKQKIEEINAIIAKQQGVEAAYAQAIAKADQYFQEKQYQNARSEYENALSLKSDEIYPQQQLQKVNGLLAQLSAQEQNYQNAIAQADQYFESKEFNRAKDFYIAALEIKTDEAYPKQKISEIEQILDLTKENRKQYDNLISSADKSFRKENWNEAKTLYEQALALFPDEIYPQNRITEIENKLLAQKSAQEQKIAREQEYAAALQNGDAYFVSKQYNESKAEYEKALALKPDEKYPRDKIEEILKILQDKQAIEKEYQRLISLADVAFNGNKYFEAKEHYQKALQVKANEVYPQQRMDEIDKLLAQRELQRQKKEALETQYVTLIATADDFLKQENYQSAKNNYQKASVLKPAELYPKEKINEIDKILATIQDIETRYTEQIKNADIQFNNQNYEIARVAYTNALGIKPEETYPQQKLDEIETLQKELEQKEKEYNKLLADADKSFDKQEWNEARTIYQQASTLFPAETYPKNRITEIDNKLAALRSAEEQQLAQDQAYNTAIANGDKLFLENKYVDAKIEFEKAAQIKPEEKYPRDKINELAAKIEEQKRIEQQYNTEIAKADKLLSSKSYNEAIMAYNSALQLKPDESYPQSKINEINTLLADEKAREEKYKNYITLANNFFMAENYTSAKENFQEALKLKPNEGYPKNKIAEIDNILAEQKRALEEMLAKNEQYNKTIKEADKEFSLKNYQNALRSYQNAQQILPDETYPGTQIAKINGILEEQQRELEAKYTKAIREGDQLSGNLKYEEAKAAYEQALLYKPDEDYPRRKINELIPKIEEQQLEEQKRLADEKKYNELIKEADDNFNKGEFVSAKATYQQALTYKPRDRYAEDQINKCDQLLQARKDALLAKEEEERQKQLEESRKSFENNDFDFAGGARSGAFLSQLAKDYPEGVTTEHYDKKNKKIKRVIVNRDGIAKEYIEVKYSYGTFYFRNGQNISRYIFLSETRE